MKNIGLNRTEEKCRYLFKEPEPKCKVFIEIYVPSDFQIDEYCLTIDHKKCPFYSIAEDATTLGEKELMLYNI
ncbi:MAG: hypothetical protein HQK91_09500 [Nitrospirae bacterium]|nr:hypothetical protein [Nitrospirota bacterium]